MLVRKKRTIKWLTDELGKKTAIMSKWYTNVLYNLIRLQDCLTLTYKNILQVQIGSMTDNYKSINLSMMSIYNRLPQFFLFIQTPK